MGNPGRSSGQHRNGKPWTPGKTGATGPRVPGRSSGYVSGVGFAHESSLVCLALSVQRRYAKDSGGYLAASLTYFSFLSLFPLLLVALSVIGFLISRDPSAQAEWAGRLSGSVPGLAPLIEENMDALARGRVATGVIGILGLTWSGLRVVEAARHALSRTSGRLEAGGLVKTKAASFLALAVLGGLGLITTALAGVVGGIRGGGFAGGLVRVLGGIFALGLDFLLFLISYRILSLGWGPRLSRLWPGAALGAAGWTALKLTGSWYATRTAAGAAAVYGTFAGVVGVMLLLYLASRLFIYGAELNWVLIEGGDSMPTERERPIAVANGRERSTAELIRLIGQDVSTLLRREVELARKEVVGAVGARLMALGSVAGAGILALVGLVFCGLAAAAALDAAQVAPWASRLIVAAIFLVLAAGGAGFAWTRMKNPPLMPEQTKRTIREDVKWARAQLKR